MGTGNVPANRRFAALFCSPTRGSPVISADASPMRLLLLLILAAMSTCSRQSFVVEKPAFRELVPVDATVEKLAGGFQFTEGPAWNTAGGFLVFSDIPADRMHRYDPTTKSVTIFRAPSQHANGNIYDAAGNIITLDQGSHRIKI